MKRILAFILALCLVFSLVPATVFAEDQSQGQAQVDTGDLTVEGTNGFGTLLSQDIMESQEETTEAEEDYKAGYSIIDLTFEGSTATVAYSSLEKAILVVAVYSEDGLKMLASGTVPVSPDETQTTVAIEGNMPEYFLASAYLMDTFDLSPLCASYDTPMYTREMQELLASTVEDYDEDRVLNLDDSLTTNFAVYSQDTKIIDYVEGVNLVSSVDEENKIYVIENADEQFTELDTGDVFAYAYGTDELLIVKVGEISVDDTTVTITGESVELDEVFDNLKIQGENDARDAEVDDSEADEGITYDGMTAEETAPVVYGSAARDGGTSNKFSLNFKAECFDHKDTTKVKVQVSGTISYSITVSLEYYITRNHKRIECRFPNELSFEGTLSFKAGNKGISLNIGSIKLMIAPGVTMAFKPEIIFEFTGEITGRFGISEMLGFAFETSKDGSDWDALHDNATFFYEAEFVGKLFIGLKLTPAIEILGGARRKYP